jgi:colanic acid/amylovoran biosynthesis protein
MRALVIGAGMANKGAELMLRTLVSEMSRRLPQIELGLSPAIPNYRRARDLGLARLAVPLFNPGYRYHFPVPFALRRFFPAWGAGDIWGWSEIDLILDISGFAYTDEWGTAGARNLARIARDLTKRGGHIILFPQGFGPFDQPGHAAAMREALGHADLVFARDHVSRAYLEPLRSPREVLVAPDITLARGVEQAATGNWAAVVPNIRMLDQGNARWGESYVSTMGRLVDRIAGAGLTPVVIVHDQGGDDASLSEAIMAAATATDIDVVSDPDPLSLKRRLAAAQFVVGSRFHALASSLSCNVPVLALGWSHKYRELLSTYGMEEFCFDVPSDDVFARLETLLDHTSREEIRMELRHRNRGVRDRIEDMWRLIERRIGEFERHSPRMSR